MTSFSKKVKKELSEINNLSNKTLDWFELFGYSLTNSSKEFITESKYNINRYARILDNVGVNDYNIGISGKNFAIKTKKTLDDVLRGENAIEYDKIMNNADFGKNDHSNERNFLIDENANKAIIRGAFLGSGTISDPRKGYHLEIYFKDEKSLYIAIGILNYYNINVKSIEQKKWILYIEEGESISNFLAFVGAKNSVLEFEETRVVKEIRNNVNRQINLENANLNKTILSSVKQINYIKLIKKKNRFNELSDKERKLAEIRLKNPDASLDDLRKMLGENISKSGVSHRMKKIERLAEKLENN
jgi:DNA-binding protein WhiA